MIDESKMYVVIGVLLIILFGIFVYLLTLDLKLRKLERKKRKMEASGNNYLRNNQEQQ